MPDTPLSRGEFEQYCKAVNGELHDIKRMAEMAATKADHTCELTDAKLQTITNQLSEIQKGLWSRGQVFYVTTITALFMGVTATLITAIVTHVMK
jgi:hypothetical protein